MSGNVRKRNTEKNEVKSPSIMTTVRKALKAEADWQDKDEFLDVVYWLRQLLGLVIGLAWGILPIKGILGLLLFFALNAVIVYVYFSSYQKVDEEEYGGITELLKEGLMTSFATFLVSWIILYSALHYD